MSTRCFSCFTIEMDRVRQYGVEYSRFFVLFLIGFVGGGIPHEICTKKQQITALLESASAIVLMERDCEERNICLAARRVHKFCDNRVAWRHCRKSGVRSFPVSTQITRTSGVAVAWSGTDRSKKILVKEHRKSEIRHVANVSIMVNLIRNYLSVCGSSVLKNS